jgi:pimeloyl-ACP methyl ester carboxylesterase
MTVVARRPASTPEPPLDLPEQRRARYPDATGVVERDGIGVAWERYGDGSPTILLMPTWSVYPSRHWKGQIPFLARHFRVVTFDGRGNGRSDRPAGSDAYADTEFIADAVAVLDSTATDTAVVCGLSMGAGYAIRLAAEHPDRVLGLVLFGAAVDVRDVEPGASRHDDASFEEPQPSDDAWAKYNAHYWRRDWRGFAAWFSGVIFSEPHSTKQIEDGVGWFLGTDPETIIATERAPYLVAPDAWGPPSPTEGSAIPFVRRVRCPSLVVHGTDDRIIGIAVGRRLAAELGAPIVEIEGGGHSPIGRDPVRSNLLVRDFVRGLEARAR